MKTAQLEVIINIERGSLSFRTTRREGLLNEGPSMPRTYYDGKEAQTSIK